MSSVESLGGVLDAPWTGFFPPMRGPLTRHMSIRARVTPLFFFFFVFLFLLVKRVLGPLRRPGLVGGGLGRFPRGFRGGGGFGGGGMGGMRSGFGGTANR